MILYLNCYHDPAQKSWTKSDYLLAAAKRLGWKWVQRYNHEPNPEYIINIEPFHSFIKGSKWTAIWEIDVTFDRPQLSFSNWVACDTVFVANSNLPDRMKGFQGEKIVLFQACDPLIHRRIPDITPRYDFVFSGTTGLDVYKERSRMMDALRFHGFSFCDFGKGYTPQDYVKKINEARVQFIRSAYKPPIANSQVEQRFFECLAIGPVLKDYHPDLDELGLVESKDYFSYRNDDEMFFKMQYLVDHLGFAQKMAVNGRRKALLCHSYEHRFITIINFIREHDPSFTIPTP